MFPLSVSPLVCATYNCFDVIHEIVEGDERKLGFEMRVFAQMAASVAWVE
jgi:hypothetical protein